MRTTTRLLISLVLVVIASTAFVPIAEAQYQPLPATPTPSVSLGFGIGVFSFGDVTRPPGCAPQGLACETSSTKPATAVFGGGFWIAGDNHRPLGFALELTGYAQPWPVKRGSTTAVGINDIAFVLAGPRMNFQRKKSGNPFVKALLGFASSDRSPGGVAVIVAAGADGSLLCHETATCIVGLEIGYRRVLGDPLLSGFQSVLRAGFGF